MIKCIEKDSKYKRFTYFNNDPPFSTSTLVGIKQHIFQITPIILSSRILFSPLPKISNSRTPHNLIYHHPTYTSQVQKCSVYVHITLGSTHIIIRSHAIPQLFSCPCFISLPGGSWLQHTEGSTTFLWEEQ